MVCNPSQLGRELVAAFTAASIPTNVFFGCDENCGIDWNGTQTAQHLSIAATVIANHNPDASATKIAAARTYLAAVRWGQRRLAITNIASLADVRVALREMNKTDAAITTLLMAVDEQLPDE